MTYDEILTRLENVKTLQSGESSARCPAHDDDKNSLTIRQVTDENSQPKILMYCHANCTLNHILEKLGLKMGDLFSTNGNGHGPACQVKPRIVATYDYADESGKLLYQAVRYEPKDFRQRQPDGKGSWAWNLKGARHVLYHLPDLVGLRPGTVVFFCEGEKDADNLAKLGYVATTNSAGAGKVKPEILKPLAGMQVIILQDNDDAGKEHTNKTAGLLQSTAASLRVVTPIMGGWGDIEHGDISDKLPADFAAAREYVDSLIKIARPWESPHKEPETTIYKSEWTAAELLAAEFTEPDYVVPDVLPGGILALLAGRPKIGKSWLALQWAAAVGNGGKIWGRQAKKGKVLYLALEDNPRRIQKRIRAQQWAAAGDVVFKFTWRSMIDGGLADLEKEIAEKEYTMVIIDTLARFAKFKQREVEEATDAIGPLQRLALEFNCTIVLIDHHRKNAGNAGDVVDDVMESTGKTAVADTIIGLYKIRGETVATLKATGRDQDETELALRWDGEFCCWQCLGEAAEVAKTEGQQVVLDALTEFDGSATTSQIAALTDKDVGYVSRVLAQLMARKVVEQPETRGPYKIINWSQNGQNGQNGQTSQNSQNEPVQEEIEF